MAWAQTIKIYKMKVKAKASIYKQAQQFAAVTKMLITIGNINRAKKCLQRAEDIFIHGTDEVKNVISNIYLYSVSGFMEIHHCNIKEMLPDNLKNEYYKQVNAAGV